MRIPVGLMAAMLAANAWAADPGKPPATPDRRTQKQTWLRVMELEKRARQVYPGRRDTPLRYVNITDEEVREVQVIARKYRMPELLNISPVVTGCPCEEGGACTEQVYIVSRNGESTVGLQLSRQKNLWTVGVVQRWWLEYAALLSRQRNLAYLEFEQLREQKLLAFPSCDEPTEREASATQVALEQTQSPNQSSQNNPRK
jgi:hypothetical protein